MINLIKPISSLTQNLIKNISKVHRIDEDLIVLVFNGYSGSNLSPIIEQIKNGELSKYKIKVLKEETTKKSSNFEKIKFMWKKFSLLSKAKLVITTHGPMKIKKKTVNLELWHGFPLKGINLMDGNVRVKNNLNSIDFSISLSQTYSTLLNSCLGIDGDKYKITGYPRNDYLIKSNGRKVLSKILNYDLTNKKVILYMPTYRKTKNNRKEDGNKNYNNIFGYDYFEAEKFNSFLELNNFIFVFKLHPNEEELFKDTFDYKYENIKLITGSMLAEHNTDLYEIVNAANLLITDFSSIYLDYLLLDRPIIFTPVDLESYSNSRGFLVNPFEFWLPGDICLNYDDLIEKIIVNIEDDKNKDKRTIIKNIVHEHFDSDSTKRVINLINNIMKNEYV